MRSFPAGFCFARFSLGIVFILGVWGQSAHAAKCSATVPSLLYETRVIINEHQDKYYDAATPLSELNEALTREVGSEQECRDIGADLLKRRKIRVARWFNGRGPEFQNISIPSSIRMNFQGSSREPIVIEIKSDRR